MQTNSRTSLPGSKSSRVSSSKSAGKRARRTHTEPPIAEANASTPQL